MPSDTRLVLAILAALLYLPGGCLRSAGKASLSHLTENVKVLEESWPDGTPRLRRQVLEDAVGMLLNHGSYVRWHNNGQKHYEATFALGKKQGTATLWHRNGRKWIEEHYLDGEKHGARRIWNEDGRKRKEEHFERGKPHGTWTIWRDNGEIQYQQSFDHGTPLP
ncbi:MAG: toxin-antitoxin system YwqK family antitoxin [Planctomycetota bacterium]